MADVIEQQMTEPAVEPDLVATVHRILQTSSEPMTVSKIRAQLPAGFRSVSLEELAETLHRQAAASVIFQFPRYRSQQDRFWDRPMPMHLANLLRDLLEEGPLPWSELRRKLPNYAQAQAEQVLEEQVAQGLLHRHPRLGRGGERFGTQPADAKTYLRILLPALFRDLAELGFAEAQVRAGALELLHDEEWSATPAQASVEPAPPPSPEPSPAAEEKNDTLF